MFLRVARGKTCRGVGGIVFLLCFLAACATPDSGIPTLAAFPSATLEVPIHTADPLQLTATRFVIESTSAAATESALTAAAPTSTSTATPTRTATVNPIPTSETGTPIPTIEVNLSETPIPFIEPTDPIAATSVSAFSAPTVAVAVAVLPTTPVSLPSSTPVLPTIVPTETLTPGTPTIEAWRTAAPETVPPQLQIPTVATREFSGVPTPLIAAITIATHTPTITLTPSASPFPTPIGDASVTTASSQLVNLMREPSLTAQIVEAVSSGENVFLIGRSDNGEWYQVRRMNGTEGWIYGLYLVIWSDINRVVITHFEPTEPPVAMVGGFALGGHLMNLNENAFSTAREAGMTWIKIQHRYYNGERVSAVTGIINTIHRAGFRVVLGVVGDRGQLASIPNYHAGFASFVAGAAQAGADAIEIWNEPNIDREWPRGFIHGGNYTELLRAAYTAIKAVNPTTIVISAAPAPTGFFGPAGCGDGGCNDDIFLTQMAFAGAQNYLDCVGLHHNDGIVSPAQGSGDPRGDHPTYFLRGVMSRVPSEFNTRPMCFTEVGYLSPEGYGPLPPNFAWANSTSISEHAQWLGEAVSIARLSGRVQMFIVWNIDFSVYTFEDPMAGWAIRRRDGGCPACAALRAAMG